MTNFYWRSHLLGDPPLSSKTTCIRSGILSGGACRAVSRHSLGRTVSHFLNIHFSDIVKSLVWSFVSLTLIDRGISQAQSPPQPSIPIELERLEYFEGAWSCQQPAESTKPSGNFSWTVQQDLNQFWYLGNAKQTLPPSNGLPINSRDFMGYDTASKQLIRSVVVGNGSSYNLVAEDWQNDKLIWSGILVKRGQATPLRQEIVRNSPDKFTATYFFPNDGGEWIPIVDETCDRLNIPPK